MKTLTLLRHAKSGLDTSGLRDFDRTLNAKGRRAAQAVGRHWRSLGLGFDHVVASPAARVRETVDEFGAGYGAPLAPAWDRRAYLAEPDTLLEIVQALPPEAERALLVAHNPGLERLALLLAGEGDAALLDAVAMKYPTATVAELAVPDGWTSARPGAATLTRFVRPRDLDPALGPDEE